ncbi:glycosyltransferase [Pseudarthrobacter sp. NPDC080039]|uniref:glycosyltransferase n=1 Tax=unclassified Pseudarthrobacter TaxID=2647000 RepID=UPI00344F8239
MSRKVVVIGTRGYPSFYGGFETAVRHLAPYLADQGWDVTVFGRAGAIQDDASRDARVRSVITSGFETKSLSTLSFGLVATLKTIRMKPDVALVMNVANGYWLPLLRIFQIPTVVNVDGVEWQREKWGPLAKLVFRIGGRLTAWFANELVVDAEAIGQFWHDKYGRRGIFIPYGGVQPEATPVPLGLTSRGYILVVARLVPENSIEHFLDAAESLAGRYDIVIVGSAGYGGEIEAKLAAFADREHSVRWLGHVSDDNLLDRLWQHCGVYFHGHSVGGTNPALVQAMTCGAPTIALDTTYNREVLGRSGHFVEQSGKSIAAAIEALISNAKEQSRLSELARSRALKVYTWTKVCSSYNSLLSAFSKDKHASS